MADGKFTIVTDDEGGFYIVAPDDTEGDAGEPGDIVVCEYEGMTYFATDGDDFPGMAAGVVYRLGSAMPTDAEDEDLTGDEDDDDTDESDDSDDAVHGG